MQKIFWIECPACGVRWYAELPLRDHPTLKLICPKCQHQLHAHEAKWIDDRGTR